MTNEQKLIAVARKFIDNPQSETMMHQLFDLAPTVVDPQTDAARAIVRYVKTEQATDFSLAAGDEFEAMRRAVGILAT